MFYKLSYGGDEKWEELVTSGGRGGWKKRRNDIMTSWWTPTKIFLLGNKKELMQNQRKELEEVLLERFYKGKDEEQLRESLSKIRHEKQGKNRKKTL